MTGSDMSIIMNGVSLPVNTTQTEALVVQVQGIDVVISLLTVITILLFFILYFLIKRRAGA